MKKVSVSGSPRENVGKKDAKRLRREGNVPCVVYGGKEQIQFYTSEKSFKDIVFTPDACTVKLDIAGKKMDAILQDIQYHPVTDRIIHADFLEIFPDKPVKMSLPIKVKGSSPGVLAGGKMLIKRRRLNVMALADELPAEVDIDISSLKIGDSVVVGQLSVKNVQFMDPENSVVVLVKSARAAMMAPVEPEEDEAAEGEAAEGEAAGEAASDEAAAQEGDAAKE
ncbi:MAG: 50S ribosomal protein L25/general stress protein Ctc [Bacteroidales bacterium]|nr:50S ribosomal protein L25/general stress protein Ctc [Bacteroidales bacterium]